MSQALSQLEPKQIWKNFSKLNAIPRGSKKEEKIVAFMVEFGKSLGPGNQSRRSKKCADQKTRHAKNAEPQNCGIAIASGYGSPEK